MYRSIFQNCLQMVTVLPAGNMVYTYPWELAWHNRSRVHTYMALSIKVHTQHYTLTMCNVHIRLHYVLYTDVSVNTWFVLIKYFTVLADSQQTWHAWADRSTKNNIVIYTYMYFAGVMYNYGLKWLNLFCTSGARVMNVAEPMTFCSIRSSTIYRQLFPT